MGHLPSNEEGHGFVAGLWDSRGADKFGVWRSLERKKR